MPADLPDVHTDEQPQREPRAPERKAWRPPPDACDQFGDEREGFDPTDTKKMYDAGVKKAMEAVIIACDAGASVSKIREAAQAMIDHIDQKES